MAISYNLYPEVKCSLSSFSLFLILLINAFFIVLLALSNLELPPELLEELLLEELSEEPPSEKLLEELSSEKLSSKLLLEKLLPILFLLFNN